MATRVRRVRACGPGLFAGTAFLTVERIFARRAFAPANHSLCLEARVLAVRVRAGMARERRHHGRIETANNAGLWLRPRVLYSPSPANPQQNSCGSRTHCPHTHSKAQTK